MSENIEKEKQSRRIEKSDAKHSSKQICLDTIILILLKIKQGQRSGHYI